MRTLLGLLVSLALLACGEAPGGESEAVAAGDTMPESAPRFDDPEVERIYDRMMAEVAPEDGWERARFLAFDWILDRGSGEPVRRSHRWDRWEGRVRVEAPSDGGPMVALFDTDAAADGRVWMGGQEVEGAAADSLLERANAIHVNDSYWLVMPFKWDDPGVDARFLGERTDSAGDTWQVVELSFRDVGLTPENAYRAYVNPATGRMERWEHFRTADADPSPAGWTDWRPFGPILLATQRPFPGGGRIHFENVRVSEEVPAGAFEPPTG